MTDDFELIKSVLADEISQEEAERAALRRQLLQVSKRRPGRYRSYRVRSLAGAIAQATKFIKVASGVVAASGPDEWLEGILNGFN